MSCVENSKEKDEKLKWSSGHYKGYSVVSKLSLFSEWNETNCIRERVQEKIRKSYQLFYPIYILVLFFLHLFFALTWNEIRLPVGNYVFLLLYYFK